MSDRNDILSTAREVIHLVLVAPKYDTGDVRDPGALERQVAAALVRLTHPPTPTSLDEKFLLRLTQRERQVVRRLVAGQTTNEIGKAMNLTISTVNTYMKRIFAKLDVHSRIELVARATGRAAA